MENIKMVAPCMLGIEGLVSNELKRMGALNVSAENGRVLFEGDENILARANIQSRYSERIMVLVGSFYAESFDELFEGVKALEWERFIGKNDAFPVTGRSLDSRLTSIPDCQKIIKKAVVDRLSSKYNIKWFEETGAMYRIRFLIFKNKVSVMLDSSGEGLHKRGYRAVSNDAPIRETLAAAMADLSFVKSFHTVHDPFCGSGTILIESALKALNIAPGVNRSFAAEKWECIPSQAWSDEREKAHGQVIKDATFIAYGSDIDKKTIEIAKQNAKKAGVSQYIDLRVADVKNFELTSERGTVICNPPYGERLLDLKTASDIYKLMGRKFIEQAGWKYMIISPEPDFEAFFGRKATKRRKLYNGTIPCQTYLFEKR